MTATYIVARIHNNSLGRVVQVDSMEEGIEFISSWVKDQFGEPLTPAEREDLENTAEYTNDTDPDNIFTFSVGMIDAD